MQLQDKRAFPVDHEVKRSVQLSVTLVMRKHGLESVFVRRAALVLVTLLRGEFFM